MKSWLSFLLLFSLACSGGDLAPKPIPPLSPSDPPSPTIYLPLVSTQHAPPGPQIAGCPLFPSDHIWNTPIDTLPVDPRSGDYIASMGGGQSRMHADFGSGEWEGAPIGIPYMVVEASQPGVPVSFEYDDESDHALYPIPANPLIEGGPDSDGDRHILLIDRDACRLYELYAAYPAGDGSWTAGSGAIFDLNGYALRPAGWTSADAAGLAILPGLVRYEEVAAGEIHHALRVTARYTREGYVWPARHDAPTSSSPSAPPMGQRFRLKADYPINAFSQEVQVVLRAMKKYGLILADNGSNWYVSGSPDERWDNDALRALHNIPGSAFEAVDSSSLMLSPDSGQVRP